MEEALRMQLLSAAALTDLVGLRINWGLRGLGADLPAVRLFEISGIPRMNLAGYSGWVRSRVQVEAWGRTYQAARDVADTIGKPGVGILVGMRATVGGIRLRTFIMGRRTDEDSDAGGALHLTALDVMVWHAAV